MKGVDIRGSTLQTIAVTSASSVTSSQLTGGDYEVFTDTSSIYVKVFNPEDTLGAFTTAYPLWRGNSKTFKVPQGGYLGFICMSGEPAADVNFISVYSYQ